MWRFVKKLLQRKSEAAHLKTGRWGEKLAERMLKKKGYRICGRRIRVGPHDELDLIAQASNTLIFVEVKTRKDEAFGRPLDAVNRAKRHKLSRAALGYLRKKRVNSGYIRFDVVEVVGTPGCSVEVRHIENAFPLDPRYRLWW